MRTLATRCDGHVECLNGEDEDVICENQNLGLWIVLGFLGVVLGVVMGLKCRDFRKKRRNLSRIVKMSRNTERLMKTLETENFEEKHDDPQFWKKINVLIFFYKWVLPARQRIQMSEMLYGLEVDHYEDSLTDREHSADMHKYLRGEGEKWFLQTNSFEMKAHTGFQTN